MLTSGPHEFRDSDKNDAMCCDQRIERLQNAHGVVRHAFPAPGERMVLLDVILHEFQLQPGLNDIRYVQWQYESQSNAHLHTAIEVEAAVKAIVSSALAIAMPCTAAPHVHASAHLIQALFDRRMSTDTCALPLQQGSQTSWIPQTCRNILLAPGQKAQPAPRNAVRRDGSMAVGTRLM